MKLSAIVRLLICLVRLCKPLITESSVDLLDNKVRKRKFETVYRTNYAQAIHQQNRAKSVRPVTLTKELMERILPYWKQKYSSEMMGTAKGIPVPISTIYYWIHSGHLGISPSEMPYPRKRKAEKKQASPNFKPAGKSIEERPERTNQRLENDHSIDHFHPKLDNT